MHSPILRFILLATALIWAGSTLADNVHRCTGLPQPLDGLSILITGPSVAQPPRTQLCHRAANAHQHLIFERTDRAVDELNKLILDVDRSTPRFLSAIVADMLIAETEHVISVLLGSLSPAGQVSGAVVHTDTGDSPNGATVKLTLLGSGHVLSTHTDQDGFFQFSDLPLEETFLIHVTDAPGATGTAYGSLLETDHSATVLVAVAAPGKGMVYGHVANPHAASDHPALVTAIFPETARAYTTATDADGNYRLDGLQIDGTVIVVGFDAETGASGSYSTAIIESAPTVEVDLALSIPPIVNPELTNAGFVDSLSGWTHSGPVEIVDRDLYFQSQD